MLVLTRRTGEAIRVGHDIVVRIVALKGNQVRVGIDAPREVAVHRQEIYELIKTEAETRE
jgi:carbon storage regulator